MTAHAASVLATHLSCEQAAAYCGFTVSTFDSWVRRGLLPAPINGGWTREALTEALDRLAREGLQAAKQEVKKRGYLKLPNLQAQPRTDELEIKKYHYYRRGMRGALPGEPGSPEFMRALIAKERRFASMRSAPAGTDQAANSSPAAAQPPLRSPPTSPKLVTRIQPASDAEPATARRRSPSPSIVPRVASESEAIATRLAAAPTTAAEEFLTEAEIVTRYRGSISAGTLRNWRSRRTGPAFIRIGRRIFYPVALLAEWEQANTVLCDVASAGHSSHAMR